MQGTINAFCLAFALFATYTQALSMAKILFIGIYYTIREVFGCHSSVTKGCGLAAARLNGNFS
jgi:hypothetical protein